MESKPFNTLKNLLFSSASTLTTFLLFILLTVVGRLLGKEDFGVFTFALSFATIFEMFTDFGLRDLSVRNISQDPKLTEKYAGNLFVWKLILCVFIYLIIVVAINILGYGSDIKLIVYILAPASLLKNFRYTLRIFFQVHNKFGWDTFLVLMERILLVAVGVSVLFYWQTLLPFVVAFTSVRFIDFIFTVFVLRNKIAKFRLQFDWSFVKKLQIDAIPLGLFFVILTIFAYIDTVMLSLMRTYGDVGLYNAAFKIYEGITIMPTIFWLVMLPRLSELFSNDKSYHSRLAVRSIKYMFITAVPTLILGVIFSDFLIQFFFKSEFILAIITLQILFIGIIFQYPNWMLNATLISMHKQKVIFWIGSIGLLIKIVLNLILIPLYSYNGSAIATVLGEGIIFIVAIFYLNAKLIKIPLFGVIGKPILAGVVAYAIIYFFQDIHLLLKLVTVGGIYTLFIFLLKTFDRTELVTVKTDFQSMLKGRINS